MSLNQDQIDALNDLPRYIKPLSPAFDYTLSDGGEGLGDILNEIEESAMALPFAVQLDEAAGSITYIGEADPGSATSAAVWRVRRMDESGNPELIIKWAGGTRNFDKIWDNRTSLTYS